MGWYGAGAAAEQMAKLLDGAERKMVGGGPLLEGKVGGGGGGGGQELGLGCQCADAGAIGGAWVE